MGRAKNTCNSAYIIYYLAILCDLFGIVKYNQRFSVTSELGDQKRSGLVQHLEVFVRQPKILRFRDVFFGKYFLNIPAAPLILFQISKLGGGFQYVFFSPLFGEMIHFD